MGAVFFRALSCLNTLAFGGTLRVKGHGLLDNNSRSSVILSKEDVQQVHAQARVASHKRDRGSRGGGFKEGWRGAWSLSVLGSLGLRGSGILSNGVVARETVKTRGLVS